MITTTANFLSYNSTGISKDKCDFISDICDKNDVQFISIQEHFKISKTLDKFFCKEFKEDNTYPLPAFRPLCQDSSRPKAGLAQLSKKSLNISKRRINTSSFRIQAQAVKFPSCEILWINTYFPTDPLTINFDHDELMAVLQEVEKVINDSSCKNVILNGDLNWDPKRNSGFFIVESL